MENSIVHTNENSASNELILEENRERLDKNCKTILDALNKGESLTGKDCIERFNMMEYRRRFKDLIDAGYPIQSKMINGRCKVWFIVNDKKTA